MARSWSNDRPSDATWILNQLEQAKAHITRPFVVEYEPSEDDPSRGGAIRLYTPDRMRVLFVPPYRFNNVRELWTLADIQGMVDQLYEGGV